MKFASILFTALCLTTAAFAQSAGEKTGVNSALGMAPKAADFVQQVAVSDMFEIESSKLAQERGDAASKTFAAKMIKDHTATSTELKAVAAKAKFEVPSAVDSAHQAKLDRLKGLQGADFDKEYDSMQLDAHKTAVELFERYSKSGDNPELKKFAGKHLPHLKQHLKMAQELPAKSTAQKK